MAWRVDIGTLAPAKRLADGRLRADGRLSRVGVFTYRNPDGSERREYRPPEEVQHADSLASFALVPVTDDHPPELLTADNAREHAVGAVGENVRTDGDFVAAPLVIFDAKTIAKLDAGKVQLSCGYEADLDETPGIAPGGQRYDAIQRKIRGNHVAIVSSGRAGPDVRVRMDAAIMVADSAAAREPAMDDLKKALMDVANLTARVEAEKARADKAEAERDSATARADKAEAERDAATARADESEKARKDTDDSFGDKIKAAVKERVQLEMAASKILPAETKLDGMTDRQIRVAVVKHVDKLDIEDAKSDDYVGAYFDSAVKRSTEGAAAITDARRSTTTITPPIPPGDTDPEEVARQAMLKRHMDASKPASN